MLRKIAFSLTYSMDDNQTVQAGNLRLQCPVPYQLHGPVRLIRVLLSRLVLSFHESLGSGCCPLLPLLGMKTGREIPVPSRFEYYFFPIVFELFMN
jgi:hypothetical protein